MKLELDPTEAETLRATLALHLQEVRQEWSHTEDHDYRHDLFRTIESLERILARLPAAAPAAGAQKSVA